MYIADVLRVYATSAAVWWNYTAVMVSVSGVLAYAAGDLLDPKGAGRERMQRWGHRVALLGLLPLCLSVNESAYQSPGGMWHSPSFLVWIAVGLAALAGVAALRGKASDRLEKLGIVVLLLGQLSLFRMFWSWKGVRISLSAGALAVAAQLIFRRRYHVLNARWLVFVLPLAVIVAPSVRTWLGERSEARRLAAQPSEQHKLDIRVDHGPVWSLAVHDGTLWAACEKGLLKVPLGGGTPELIDRIEGRGLQSVTRVRVDPRGRVWAGGACGLLVVDQGRAGWADAQLPRGPQSEHAQLVDFAIGPEGVPWVLLGQGVLRLTAKGSEPVAIFAPHDAGMSDEKRRSLPGELPLHGGRLLVDARGRPWVYAEHRLWVHRDGRWEGTAAGGSSELQSLCEDRAGTIWFGAKGILCTARVEAGPVLVERQLDLKCERIGGPSAGELIARPDGTILVLTTSGVSMVRGRAREDLHPSWRLTGLPIAVGPEGEVYTGGFSQLWRIERAEVERAAAALRAGQASPAASPGARP